MCTGALRPLRVWRAHLSHGKGMHAFDVEGHAGQQNGYGVASGIVEAHAGEAVAALESAEHTFHSSAYQRERVVALDLRRRQRTLCARTPHHAIPAAMLGQVGAELSAVIAAIAVDGSGLLRH